MAELDDFRWLVSPAGCDAIQSAGDLVAQHDLVATATRLRRHLTAAQSNLVLQQVELRQRGRQKFSAAQRLFFSDQALQQASSDSLASYKAARFPNDRPVHDLCCGIGGDLFSLARRGPTVGVERDPAIAMLAAANCEALGLTNAQVEQRDATQIPFCEMPLVHIDPDRRAHGRRTTTVAFHEPGVAFLDALLNHCEGGAIKLAPVTEVPNTWRERTELEWISHQGECKQLVAWFGTLAADAGKSVATVIGADNRHTSIVSQGDAPQPRIVETLGRYLFEPDNAVIAARLIDQLAQREGLSLLGEGVAYLTGDAYSAFPLLAAFQIIEHVPFDIKQVKAMLKRHDVGTLEIKKRGVNVLPERLRKQLAARGNVPATLLLTPFSGRVTAILARRATTPDQD